MDYALHEQVKLLREDIKDIAKELKEMAKILAVNTESLVTHVKRTDILEEEVKENREALAEMEGREEGARDFRVKLAWGFGLIGTLAGIAFAVSKMI